MGNIVCDGTQFTCSKGTAPLKIVVPSSSATGEGKNLANTNSKLFVPMGTMCLAPGTTPPPPCVPAVTSIDPGQKVVEISGQPALGQNCKCSCGMRGTLEVSSPGQTKAKHEEASGMGTAAAAAAGTLIGIGPEDKGKSEEGKENKQDENSKKSSKRKKEGNIDPKLKKDPFKDPNLENKSHPEAAKKGHYTFKDKKTGETVRFDKGKPGANGHEARDHYHRVNPNKTGKKDYYLDGNGSPVPKGSDASHLYPPD